MVVVLVVSAVTAALVVVERLVQRIVLIFRVSIAYRELLVRVLLLRHRHHPLLRHRLLLSAVMQSVMAARLVLLAPVTAARALVVVRVFHAAQQPAAVG